MLAVISTLKVTSSESKEKPFMLLYGINSISKCGGLREESGLYVKTIFLFVKKAKASKLLKVLRIFSSGEMNGFILLPKESSKCSSYLKNGVLIEPIITPFFEYEKPLGYAFSSNLMSLLSDDEEIFKLLRSSIYLAIFTNKRMIFTYAPHSSLVPSDFEAEFISYKSIRSISLLCNKNISNYNVEILTDIDAFLQFCFSNSDDANSFVKTLNQYTV